MPAAAPREIDDGYRWWVALSNTTVTQQGA
jgi:hypothetical protein